MCRWWRSWPAGWRFPRRSAPGLQADEGGAAPVVDGVWIGEVEYRQRRLRGNFGRRVGRHGDHAGYVAPERRLAVGGPIDLELGEIAPFIAFDQHQVGLGRQH